MRRNGGTFPPLVMFWPLERSWPKEDLATYGGAKVQQRNGSASAADPLQERMDRIVVVGCPGSGKSTLARELASQTGIPAFHLDQLYWQADWMPHPDQEMFRKAVDSIVAGDRWILDGCFFDRAGSVRLERADTLVILDISTGVCLFRAVKRWWTYRGDARPDLPPGCSEKFDLEFYQYILTYRTMQTPKLDALVAQHFKGRLIWDPTPRRQGCI